MSAACFTPDGTLVIPAVLAPERWSVPPSPGLEPIVPCDDPDDDDRAQVLPAIRTPVPPRWLPQPPLPSFADEIARDPVVLPMGRARPSGDRLRLFLAAVASLAVVGASGAALALLV